MKLIQFSMTCIFNLCLAASYYFLTICPKEKGNYNTYGTSLYHGQWQWYQQKLLLVLHPSTLCRLYICGHVDKRRVMADEKLWWLLGNSNLDMIVVLCPVVQASIGISQHQYFCCLISPPDNLNLDQTQNYF